MLIDLPYETSGQQLGETRTAMAKTLMRDIGKIIDLPACKKIDGKFYILVHAKPYPFEHNKIKIKQIVMTQKPSMMLSCMLFGCDNRTGTLTLEWSLPGDWPTWSVGGTNEPVPEVIASVTKAGINYHYDDLLSC